MTTTASATCQPALFETAKEYQPRPSRYFGVQRIILAKGSLQTPDRRRLAESICATYPKAEIQEQLDTPHNQVDLHETDPLKLHRRGKRTLVLGIHQSAVRHSSEDGNMCPNYWHFSPYGFCPYGCDYCYLAGSRGVKFSPTVKVFLNLPEILDHIDRIARKAAEPTPFYLGKLQDGMALDSLTGFSRPMVRFFAEHPFARMTLLTKCPDVENLLHLKHNGHSILSWTTNPLQIDRQFEPNTPPVGQRIEAMKACAEAGYPVRAVVMPIIPIDDWQSVYQEFIERLLEEVPLQRITLGGTCIYKPARQLVQIKLGKDNAITQPLDSPSEDGRARYPEVLRVNIYRSLISTIRRIRPNLQIALCLEDQSVFEALDMTAAYGKCNCRL